MLLAVDVGNTQTVLGLYRDAELVDHWRLATERSSTADELGVLLDGPPRPRERRRDLPRVDGAGARPRMGGAGREVGACAAARRWAGSQDGHPDPLRRSARGGGGPDRERRRREGALRRPRDRRRLRDVDELRRGLAGRRVRGRCHRAGHRDLDGCALRARRSARQGRLLALPSPSSARRPSPACSPASSTGSRVRWTASSDGSGASSEPRRARSQPGGLADLVAPHSSAIEGIDPFLTLEGLRLVAELNA